MVAFYFRGVCRTGVLPKRRWCLGYFCMAFVVFIAFGLSAVGGESFSIDAAFPGGNILVERIDGDTVHLRPDLRDTEGWWFYWNFRVADVPAGKTLTFDFGRPNPIGVRGPAVSTDGGASWCWLGADHVVDASFTYTFDGPTSEAWFAFAVPYVESDLCAFLQAHDASAALEADVLCKSLAGREVELLRAGCLTGNPKHRVLLTARHHACESMASFVLEGILDAVLADDPVGAWFQEHVEVLAIPFMDKDGVEQGDQGKNRRPRDHNRDYVGESIYPEVAALRTLVPEWSDGLLRIALDLHCPYIRGDYNEHIYIVGSADSAIWESQQAFGALLEEVNDGPLPYRASDNLPHGVAWNTASNLDGGLSFGRWAGGIPGIWFSGTLEIPYANVHGVPVTAESARAFGRSLAEAIKTYLADESQPRAKDKR